MTRQPPVGDLYPVVLAREDGRRGSAQGAVVDTQLEHKSLPDGATGWHTIDVTVT
jgi:hypothetical protein